ncbi:coatomer subunit beta' [Nematocida sp. AWRm80]|nr:coatomer subunit beta' [Nematocida sp. AWRm80]
MEDRVSKRVEKARVKCIAGHRKDPLALVTMYNGEFELWNTSGMSMIKSGTIGEIPIRCGQFLEEKEVILLGSDDGMLRMYCMDTFELKYKVHAHKDFIRSIAVHPTLPYIATASDDMTVKVWDYSKDLSLIRTLEGHTHFVMGVCFSPKDSKTLVSCSLDHDICIWNIENGSTQRVLKGGKSGLNAVEYITEKYLVSGGDDGKINIWDISTGTCITSVPAHTGPVTAIHGTSRGFITTGEDGLVREWDKKRFRSDSSISAKVQRIWAVITTHRSDILVGGDDGIAFITKRSNEVLFTFTRSKNDARIVLADDTQLKQVKTANPSMTKSITILSYLPDRLVLSESGRYIAVESDGTTHIYTLLGFLLQISVPGTSIVWTGPEDFLILYEKQIVQYTDFEVNKKIKLDISGNIKSIQAVSHNKILVCLEEGTSYIINHQGKIYYVLDDVIGAHLHENVLVAVYKNKIEMYNVPEDGTKDIKSTITKHSIYQCKVSSWCAKDNVLFVHSEEKVVYFVVPQKLVTSQMCPISVNQLSTNGVLMGVTDSLWYIENGSVNNYEIQWDLIDFQGEVLSGHIPKTVPKTHSKECIYFLIGMNMLNEAYSLTDNPDEQFELLIRLNKLEEAMKVSDSEAKYSKLCSLFIEQNQITNALECAKKSSQIENEILLSALCNDLSNLKTTAKKALHQGNSLLSLAAAYRAGDYHLCKEILKNTEYYALFTKTHSQHLNTPN